MRKRVFKKNFDIKKKLKQLLDNSIVNHKLDIMKNKTLKDAHIYCKIHKLSGQISGNLIENYIKNKHHMTKNSPSSCSGDLYSNEKNIEIKVSNGGKTNDKFNYVQLRMNHDCEYILTAYYLTKFNLKNLGELFIFRIQKNDIKKLILRHGNYAHGTFQNLGKITEEDLNNIKNDKEYSIRPKYGDKCWNDLLKFKIDEKDI